MNKSSGFLTSALAVLAAHVPCCGSQLLMAALGAHGAGALSGAFFHEMERLAPLVVAMGVTVYMVLLTRSEQKKHACCAQGHEKEHAAHRLSVKEIAVFFLANLAVGYALGYAAHAIFHTHH